VRSAECRTVSLNYVFPGTVGHGTNARAVLSHGFSTAGQPGRPVSRLFAAVTTFSTSGPGFLFSNAWDSGTRGVNFIRCNIKVSHQTVPFSGPMGHLGRDTSGRNANMRERALTLSVSDSQTLVRLGARSLTVAFLPVRATGDYFTSRG
jgi:hypothetical protein